MLNYCIILNSDNLINLKYADEQLLNNKLDYMLLEESVKLTLKCFPCCIRIRLIAFYKPIST